MMQATYIAQLAFAAFLVIFTCFGHVSLVPAIKWSSKELCPFIINSAVFDALVIVTGPLVLFLSHYLGASFDVNSRACQTVEFFQGYSICGSLIALGIVAWLNRKHYTVQLTPCLTGLIIACSWVIPIIFGCYSLFVQSEHESRIPWLLMCSATRDYSDGNDSPIIEMINVLLAIGTCTIITFVIYLGRQKSMIYHVQYQWKRHRREVNINSPECSTIGFSDSTSISMERNISLNSLNKLKPYYPPGYFIQRNKNIARNDSTNTDINEVFYDKGMKFNGLENDEIAERCRRYGESRSIPSQSSIATDRLSQEFEFVQSVIPPSETDSPCDHQSEVQSSCFEESPTKFNLSPFAGESSPPSSRTGWYPSPSPISPFPSPPYPATLNFKDLKRLKSTKYIFNSPYIIDFEKDDRDSFNLKSLIFMITCLTLIAWSWLGVVLLFRISLGEVPEGLWVISTWLIYLRLSLSSIIYTTYFAEEWLVMWRMEWYYKGYGSSVELSSCSLKIGDPKAVKLTKLTIFKC